MTQGYKNFKIAILDLLDYLDEAVINNFVALEYNNNNVALVKTFNLLNNKERDPDKDLSIVNDNGKLTVPASCLMYLLKHKIEQNL